jgi:AraC-like DNA-binding protein
VTPHAAALDRALATLEIRAEYALRSTLRAGERVLVPRGEATLLFVRSGEITGDIGENVGCSIDAGSGRAARMRGRRTLLAGDALVSLGCEDLALTSQSGAEITVISVEVTRTVTSGALPGVVFVNDFTRAEPAAAALAAHLGQFGGEGDAVRSTDDVICRIMVRTVVLAAIRAWAFADANAAWPPRAEDPFLDRVAAAIAADPGHPWTTDELAGIAAMSRSVFAERFRETFGRSPGGYVTDARVSRAKELLEAGESVSEVSRALGYASDEGFRRAFRRVTGVAPSQWRAAAPPVAVAQR